MDWRVLLCGVGLEPVFSLVTARVCLASPRRISRRPDSKLAIPGIRRGLAAFLPECSIHFYRPYTFDDLFLPPFLGRPGADSALRHDGDGAGVCVLVFNAGRGQAR